MQNISGPKPTVIPFSLATAYGRTGSITVAGNITPTPEIRRERATLQRIPLREANTHLPDNLAVTIAGVRIDSRMKSNRAQVAA